MVAQASDLRRITLAASSQSIGAAYRKMLVLADEPSVMEFKLVPDWTEQVEAEMMETEAKIALLAAELELNTAAARLSRAIGMRSLQEEAHNEESN
jgi:hypothetical protein